MATFYGRFSHYLGRVVVALCVVLAANVATATPSHAWSLDFDTPLCHTSKFKGTGYVIGVAPPEVKTLFEAYNLTFRKDVRVYRLYTRNVIDHLSPLSDQDSDLWVHGCGGGLASARIADSNGSFRFSRFIFPGSTLFVDLGNRSAATETIGAINQKYAELGFERWLGIPTTDESATPTKFGRFNHFQNGSIYWSPATGAHEVHGAIRDKWAALGWERGDIGFPTTDELPTPVKPGRFNHFQNGYSIYWSAATGAHEVHGQIRDRWASLGWENSQLGFPISDEFSIAGGGRQSNFQNGCFIKWFPGRGATAYCNNIPRF